MTVAEYREHPALNFSKAKRLLRSPAHFATPVEKEPTLAMMAGELVHAYALEGIRKPHVVRPDKAPDGTDWHGAKKVCKEWVAKQTAPIFTAAEIAQQAGMVAALEMSEEFQSIRDLCPHRECPVFATYRGVPIKALLDLSGTDASGARMIGDLKTCDDGSPKGFVRSVVNYCYALQAVWYSTAWSLAEGMEKRPGYIWITVESSAPHNVTCYRVPDDAWALGQRQMDKIIDTYLRCQEQQSWPGYGSGILELQWPRWANDQE